MPKIFIFECNTCKSVFHYGWGGHDYVEDDNGTRFTCFHPREHYTIRNILNLDDAKKFPQPKWWWSNNKKIALKKIIDKFIEERTGFHSFCICTNCKSEIDLDLKKDVRICPHCESHNIKSIQELVGTKCPLCNNGQIEKRDTGAIA